VSAAFAAQHKFDKAGLETWVRHLFLWGPQITVTVADPRPADVPGFYDVSVTASAGQARQEETFLVSLDGRRVIRGTVYDPARNPFASDLAKITTDGAPAVGPADAPVQLVIFSDLQCSYCAQAAKVLREQVLPAYAKDLRVVFKDMPLDAIHPWARPAAALGRCLQRQKPAAFWEYHDWMFATQQEIKPETLRAKVMEFAGKRGLDTAELERCADMPETGAAVEKSAAEARALGVNSTPTMFINGRRVVGSVGADQLRQVIDHEREYARTHKR
jgi:protein-disulfide isomerase